MSNWPLVRVADVADLLVGFPFKSNSYVKSEGVRLLRGDNVIQRDVRWENAALWPTALAPDFAEYLLQVGDIAVAMDRPWDCCTSR